MCLGEKDSNTNSFQIFSHNDNRTEKLEYKQYEVYHTMVHSMRQRRASIPTEHLHDHETENAIPAELMFKQSAVLELH